MTYERKPLTLGGAAPPTKTANKGATIVCEECKAPNEVSDSTIIRWRMNMAADSERCCRVCGLSFKQCPVGGV